MEDWKEGDILRNLGVLYVKTPKHSSDGPIFLEEGELVLFVGIKHYDWRSSTRDESWDEMLFLHEDRLLIANYSDLESRFEKVC